jgi:hypothetical protein
MAKVEISDRARAIAEEQASAHGYATADAFIEALLLLDDKSDGVEHQPWFREKIEQSLASGSAGKLTRERISQLVQEGIALAKNDR